jgi:tetratricopeptide (TPR) repeat protein
MTVLDDIRRLAESGRHSEALQLCADALRAHPRDRLVVAEMAKILAMPFPESNDTDSALTMLNEALSDSQDAPELHEALGFVYEVGLGDYGKALTSYTRAASLDPYREELYVAIGRLFRSPGVELPLEGFIDLLSKGAVVAPTNWQIRAELGDVYWYMGDTQAAAREYLAALEASPPPIPYMQEQISRWFRSASRGASFQEGRLTVVR